MGNKYIGVPYSNHGIAHNMLRAQHGRYVTGSIFYVKPTTDADYQDFINVHWEDSVRATITTGLAATTASLGDFVGVCMGSYTENLTMSKADVTLRGLGATPYATLVNGTAAVVVTITGVDVRLENLNLVTSGDGIVCVYGTGLVGGPYITNCYLTNLTHATATGLVNIAGATSRGLVVEHCTFLGGSGTALAVSYAGKGSRVQFNTAEDLNTTEATCFAPTTQYGNVAS